MINISFVNPPHADWIIPNFATWFFIQSHYNAVGKYKDQINWMKPPYKFNQYESIEDLYEEVKSSNIVLFSSYVWNYDICDELCNILNERNPNIIKILGGPHIGEYDENFEKRKSMYDFICKPTKPGETFIEDFLNEFVENE